MRSWTLLLLTLSLALAGCEPENARVEIRPVRTVLVDPKPVLDGRQAVGRSSRATRATSRSASLVSWSPAGLMSAQW